MSRRTAAPRRLKLDPEVRWHAVVIPELRLRAEQFSLILGGKHSISATVNFWMMMHYNMALYAAGTEDDAQRAEIHRRLAEREDSMMALLERMDELEERRDSARRTPCAS